MIRKISVPFYFIVFGGNPSFEAVLLWFLGDTAVSPPIWIDIGSVLSYGSCTWVGKVTCVMIYFSSAAAAAYPFNNDRTHPSMNPA